MKKFKRIAALLLALVMVFALCACDSGDKGTDKGKDDVKKTDAELAVGKWETKVNMSTILKELGDYDELEELLMYFDFSRVDISLTVEFDKSGSYELVYSVNESQLMSMFRDGMEMMLDDMLVGTGYTIEDLAADENMTRDEYLDALIEQSLDSDDLMSSIEESNESGTFEMKDGKLYLIESGDEKEDGDYIEYTIDDDELVFVTEYDDGEEEYSVIFPMTFERA